MSLTRSKGEARFEALAVPGEGERHSPEGAGAVTGPPSPGDLPRLCHVQGWEGLWLHRGDDALETVCPNTEF